MSSLAIGAGFPARVLLVGRRPPVELLRRLGEAGIPWQSVDPDRLQELALPRGDEEAPALLVLMDDPADLEPIRRLRRDFPAHPLVLVGADPDGALREGAREAGCDGVVDLDGRARSDLGSSLVAAAERRRLRARIERLEARLAAAEGRFHNTVQRVADGIMILGRDGRIRFLNRAAEELFGRSAGELLGEELGVPVTAGETTEIDILRGGREPGVVELRVTRTEWEEGECLLVSLRDVTRQREAEERERRLIGEQAARQEAEAAADRWEFLAEASRRLYSSLDSDEILGTLASLALQRAGDACFVETLVDDLQLPGHRTVRTRGDLPDGRALERLGTAGETIFGGAAVEGVMDVGEPRLLTPRNARWPEGVLASREVTRALEELGIEGLLLTPLTVGEKTVGVLAVLDLGRGRTVDPLDRPLVAELARRAGLALENARLFRLASQASRAKTDFLNVVSHELRTPLTGIMGYTGLLRDGVVGDVPEGMMEYLDGIERNSTQLLRIIDQILLFADTEEERQAVRYADESLTGLVEDVVSLARPMAEREGLELRVRVPRNDVRVRMDAAKVRQIVLHLLANATKFTREGWIELHIEARPEHLLVQVADSGIGIPESERPKIFEPFTQIEPSQTRLVGGTGIGLNVVKNLTALLGGSIEVESVAGRGSTFTVRLPLEAPQEL